ncbi:PssD/Cps14F family polysaccharide biosynthesis glycosyltransferase [Acholeplasma laidlawii]|uniref:PssD/Cps14F family polysaccharide biosynthesis glycosyltransferase n=1 Tax=Acholeplasma laidlawii TaxID=2148 RepID=UPI0025419D36|nr:PssD/Cps14F family polysaccharide biosynthesis glycosyltransferase [Acholeplasma laidlawii]
MKKIILISSSGGHFEQLMMLRYLSKKYRIKVITEKTKYKAQADYYLMQTGLKDPFFPLKIIINGFKSVYLFFKIRPDIIITTGTMVCIPLCLFAKLFKKKIVYIETFARVNDASKTGKLMYKFADLFIIQWKELQAIYPKAVYGGGIY